MRLRSTRIMPCLTTARSYPVLARRRKETKRTKPRATKWGQLNKPGSFDPFLSAMKTYVEEEWVKSVSGLEFSTFGPEWDACVSQKTPKMWLQNTVYTSERFRYLHVELGETSDGFKVLHTVCMPRTATGCPIFGMDIVKRKETVTMAIVDCSPVRRDRSLPVELAHDMDILNEYFLNNVILRPVPGWGQTIFSTRCICAKPIGTSMTTDWSRYALHLHRVYMRWVEGPQGALRDCHCREGEEGQARYVQHQRMNTKTRDLLALYFDTNFANRYMEEVLFPGGEWAQAETPGVLDR